MRTQTLLTDIQDAIVTRLDDDEWFDRMAVIAENHQDIENIIDTALAKLGMCVVVETPAASLALPNIPSFHFNEIQLTIGVYENILENATSRGSQKDALSTAMVVLYLLHHWDWTGGDGVVIYGRTPTIVRAEAPPGFRAYNIQMMTAGGYEYVSGPSLQTQNLQDLLTQGNAEIVPGA